MKKLIALSLFFTGCQANSRMYVKQTECTYSAAFKKSAAGAYKKAIPGQQWKRNSPHTPVIHVDGK